MKQEYAKSLSLSVTDVTSSAPEALIFTQFLFTESHVNLAFFS